MTTAPELFGRESQITIGNLELTGHRAVFSIVKTLEPEPNSCDLTVYNLNPSQRAELQELQPKKGATRGIPVRIEAGYKEGKSLLWLGDLRTVSSVTDGPNWVTRLSSGDGEKATKNSRIAVPYGPRTDVGTALRAMVRHLGVDEGNVAQVAAQIRLGKAGKLFTSGKVLRGPVARVISDFAESADLEWSIQDGAIQFLDRGQVRAGTAVLLSKETGLVGSPSVDNEGILTAQSLMIPDIKPGVLVVVKSKHVSGNYRAELVQWDGDTRGGDWYCTIEGKRF